MCYVTSHTDDAGRKKKERRRISVKHESADMYIGWLNKDAKHLLERIQQCFTRLVPGLKQLCHKRLASLDLWSLHLKRDVTGPIESFQNQRMFTLDPDIRTRGHSAKMLTSRRRFFSECVIDRWNSLQQQVIDCTIIAFKKRLKRTILASIGFRDLELAMP